MQGSLIESSTCFKNCNHLKNGWDIDIFCIFYFLFDGEWVNMYSLL